MEILLAAVLGVVQGLTEFLPVSSTGHLILVREIFPGAHEGSGLAFDAVLHLATTLAIVIYFWKDLLGLLHTALRFLGRMPVDQRDMTLLKALAVGTVPAVILGLLLEDLMEHTFRSPLLVAGILVLGSAIFAYAEYVYAYKSRKASMTPQTGFKIGLFQALALIPGMSRSGITISGALILGLSRVEAARFAFLLALPVMVGAGGKKLLELAAASGSTEWLSVMVGASVAFVVGLFAIHFMMNFMRTNTLWPFIWYRILLAVFVVALVFFG
jgi:undecaprenyl-diphosphatase